MEQKAKPIIVQVIIASDDYPSAYTKAARENGGKYIDYQRTPVHKSLEYHFRNTSDMVAFKNKISGLNPVDIIE